MFDTPLLDALFKADPDGRPVRHNGRIAFLRSDGHLVELVVNKAAWGRDLPSSGSSAPTGRFSSKTASTATDNAVYKPTSAAMHQKAADHHTAVSQVATSSPFQKGLSVYHAAAGKAHQASADAVYSKDAKPAAHTKAAGLHSKAAAAATALAGHPDANGATQSFMKHLASGHTSLQKFHEGKATGAPDPVKPKSTSSRPGFDRHFAQYD